VGSAILSDSERADLYRRYALALNREADASAGSERDYFRRIAASWLELAGSMEHLASIRQTSDAHIALIRPK
jgi:hypothetical protein